MDGSVPTIAEHSLLLIHHLLLFSRPLPRCYVPYINSFTFRSRTSFMSTSTSEMNFRHPGAPQGTFLAPQTPDGVIPAPQLPPIGPSPQGFGGAGNYQRGYSRYVVNPGNGGPPMFQKPSSYRGPSRHNKHKGRKCHVSLRVHCPSGCHRSCGCSRSQHPQSSFNPNLLQPDCFMNDGGVNFMNPNPQPPGQSFGQCPPPLCPPAPCPPPPCPPALLPPALGSPACPPPVCGPPGIVQGRFGPEGGAPGQKCRKVCVWFCE